MKALILAAGIGSRLAPLTNDRPKTLVEVNGKPILFQQIDNLHENGIFDITIVAGYKAGVLKEAVESKYNGINIIYNMNYLSTNNMYSAYLAKDYFYGQEFLMMNADVFYDSSVLETLLQDGFNNSIVTDIGTYNEESMKVIEDNGRLVRISKQITEENALGSSIDIYRFSEAGGKAFFDKCTDYIKSKKEVTLWSEIALNDALADVEFKACPLVGKWFEIDNINDLEEAERIFKNGKRFIKK